MFGEPTDLLAYFIHLVKGLTFMEASFAVFALLVSSAPEAREGIHSSPS